MCASFHEVHGESVVVEDEGKTARRRESGLRVEGKAIVFSGTPLNHGDKFSITVDTSSVSTIQPTDKYLFYS